ncbi:MAG: hypothetical protein FWH41_02785 [Treponema sp.]|nr:hypothetical protein [Treponema sp.]
MKISLDKKYCRQYTRESNRLHDIVPVTYQTFEIGGKKYFQLDGYNSRVDLQKTGMLQQSDYKMQFDKETAEKFIKLLKQELDID